jgi:hypothetical protein
MRAFAANICSLAPLICSLAENICLFVRRASAYESNFSLMLPTADSPSHDMISLISPLPLKLLCPLC